MRDPGAAAVEPDRGTTARRVTQTIVVPVDDTELGERAVPVAGAMAAALGARVVLVVVDSPHGDLFAGLGYLRRLHDRLPAGVPVEDVVATVARGSVADAIAAQASAWPDPLVVMASQVHTGVGDLVLGNTAAGVIAATSCPVVLVGPRCSTAWAPGPTLLALEPSAANDALLDAAESWVRATGSPLTVLHVVAATALEGGIVVTGSPGLAARAAQELRDAGVEVYATTVEAARPDAAILQWTRQRGVSLVVLGSRRRGRFERAVLGSVSMAVAHRSPCPVLIAGGGSSAR